MLRANEQGEWQVIRSQSLGATAPRETLGQEQGCRGPLAWSLSSMWRLATGPDGRTGRFLGCDLCGAGQQVLVSGPLGNKCQSRFTLDVRRV